jgi:hypothetical protein
MPWHTMPRLTRPVSGWLLAAAPVVVLCAPGLTAGAQGAAPARPRYALLRQDEDWRVLATPGAVPPDRFDPIKYVALGRGGDAFLTLGGELRPYYERFGDENWGRAPADRDGYVLHRTMVHADLHAGRIGQAAVRVFAQLKSGLIAGRRAGPRPVDEDRADVNQAFVDLALPAPRGTNVVLRAGRQELNYGAGRVVSVREGPNVRVGFDGATASLLARTWRLDAFGLRPVVTGRGAWDDRAAPGAVLAGAYLARRAAPALHLAPTGAPAGAELYYLYAARRGARFDQTGPGPPVRERRHTLGARMGHVGAAADWDVEGAVQGGRFGVGEIAPGAIRAWTAAGTLGWTFARLPATPRLGLAAGATSGDRDPSDPDLQTFAPPAPRGSYFGQIGANGPQNSVGASPTVRLRPHAALTVNADWYVFWRQSARDGLYGVPGNLLQSGRAVRARRVGSQPQVDVSWQIDRHASLTLNAARFLAGPFLRAAPPARDIRYVALWTTYRF